MTSSLANLFILLVLSVNIILSSTQSIQQANIDIPDSQILASDFLSGSNVVAVLTKNLGLRVYQFNQIYNFISDIQTCQGSSISIQEKNNFEQGSQSDKIPSFVIKVNCDDGQKQYQLDLERKEIKDITIKKNIKQELSYMGKITKGSVRLLQDITNSSCTTVTSSNGTYYCGDGNAISGDGCSSTCQVQFCGDAAINNKGTEQCDDGNSVSGDGCFNCKLQCGNGVLNFGEQCDDGNTVSGDGCSQTCRRQTVASAVPLAVGIPVVAAAILGLIFAKCAFATKAVHAVRGQPAQIMQVEQSTKMMKY